MNSLNGFGLTLSVPGESNGTSIELPFIGQDRGDCETVLIPGNIDMIRTLAGNQVRGISWHSGDWSASYGVPETPNLL